MMMHKNHLPFIPEQYRCYQHYCKPSKEVLDGCRKERSKGEEPVQKDEKAAKCEVMT
jgi:hypothetical protein